MKRIVVPIVVVLATIIGACTKVSSDPNVVVALAFDSLPYPAIVAGDTLRDESGVARALTASALNSDGDVVATAPVSFIVIDTGGTVSAEGFLVSTDPTKTSLRAIAQVGTLQSRPLTLIVTPRPDSIAANGAAPTIAYDALNDATWTSGPVGAKVLSNTVTPPVPVPGWIVHFSLEYHGTPLLETDQTWSLLDETNRRSYADTTGTDGVAARRLRVNIPTYTVDTDSIVVIATASARGATLGGAPVRMTIQVHRQ